MVPDVSVLSRLLDPSSPYNPTTAAAAAAAASTPVHGQPPTPIAGVVAAASAAAAAEAAGGPETKGQWRDSLRAINDIILRRHFADLTRLVFAFYLCKNSIEHVTDKIGEHFFNPLKTYVRFYKGCSIQKY